MDTTHASFLTRLKVGFFTLLGIVLIAAITVGLNGKPFWWRPCQLVQISVEDATGLKAKTPIRSLGIEIGYLKSVALTETRVTLGICITAPVQVLPSTRAYIRGEGFLGDKFVELKPVKYIGPKPNVDKNMETLPAQQSGRAERLWDWIVPSVWAKDAPAATKDSDPEDGTQLDQRDGREIPVGKDSQDVQHLVNRVDDLVNQMSGLTDNLKKAINPDELRSTMRQINQTLQNASKTLAPEGGLTQTAQRSLAKLEDAIEQLRDMMTRVNKGEGSVGMLLNDPTYAEELKKAVKNINHLLNRVADVRFNVDLGATYLSAYNGTRGWFQLGIWPQKDRYYLLGIAFDPRGKISQMTVSTLAGGQTTVNSTTVVDQTGLLLTGMLGKIFFNRYDVAIGALYGDAAASISVRLGPVGSEDRIQLKNDVYVRNSAAGLDDRITLTAQPIQGLYLRAGLESVRGYPTAGQNFGQPVFAFGAGITFDDDDIKLLFALK